MLNPSRTYFIFTVGLASQPRSVYTCTGVEFPIYLECKRIKILIIKNYDKNVNKYNFIHHNLKEKSLYIYMYINSSPTLAKFMGLCANFIFSI